MTIDELHSRLARSLEPLTYDEMLACSSDQGVRAAIAAGSIVRVLPNRYAARVHAESWVVRARAALAWAGPDAALAGTSALYVWGGADQPHSVSLMAPWVQRPRGPAWIRVKRFTSPQPILDQRGFRVVSPELAVITAHAELPPGHRAEAVFRPVRSGLVTPDGVAADLARLGRIRARGELKRRLAAAATGAESFLEEEAGSHVFTGPEFASLVRQHLVRVEGALYRLDAFDPTTLTAFELDGQGTHASPDARRSDLERDARLASIGILTIRFDFASVVGRPDWCRRIALAALARRASGGQGVGGGVSVPNSAAGARLEG